MIELGGTQSSESVRERFCARHDLTFDRFQTDAFDAIDRGEHVVVAAPTGSGKTIVAEYGIETARAASRRAFYTAPIKALSNQKFHDLSADYGRGAVGLLTGDRSIDGDAGIVVMTTEVLRNMIYADGDLSDLGVVVMDEVHFLQDAYRGSVWEEVIIQLPEHVQLVCLSATVSNHEELAGWIETVRGPTRSIVETTRPVPLDHVYLVSDRASGTTVGIPTLRRGSPNPAARRFDTGPGRERGYRGRPQRRFATPTRLDVLDYLVEQDLLPAIHFVFSRQGCFEAARDVALSGVRLTDSDQSAAALRIADEGTAHISPDDLDALGYDNFRVQLAAGVAPHHAGMVPAFKEVVEACFNAGCIRLVYATETLAVGVNMPARSVVIDRLSRYTGDHHEILTAGTFTQLAGRAGRRGIDTDGTAVTLWSPFVEFDQVASLAAATSFPLRSAFRPSYNMIANLIERVDESAAREFLSLSFAQYQADLHVVRLEGTLRRLRKKLAEQLEAAHSPFGDIAEYVRAVGGERTGDDEVEDALANLKPGSIIDVEVGTFKGPAAVVATAQRSAGVKVSLITAAGRLADVRATDFDRPPEVRATIALPGAYAPRQRTYREKVGERIKSATRKQDAPASRTTRRRAGPVRDEAVRDDPDLARRISSFHAAQNTAAEIERLEKRLARRDGALGRRLDQVLDVLGEVGAVRAGQWQLSVAGTSLASIFHENDLLIWQALSTGLFDRLEPPEVAALVSAFVYEHRAPGDPPLPWFPNPGVRDRWEKIEALSRNLARIERGAGLDPHRDPDPSLFAAAYAWVSGTDLSDVLEPEVTGGDFVRAIRQLIDVLDQISKVATDPATRAATAAAARAAYRDVVAIERDPAADDDDPDGQDDQDDQDGQDDPS